VELIGLQADCHEFLIADFHPFGILGGVKLCPHLQAAASARIGYQVDHHLVADEGLSAPVHAKEKQGRSNLYTLREKILITDHTGKPAGQATWDYLPDAVRAAVADVKNVLMSGSFDDAKVVKIENLQVVIVNAEPGATVNVNSGVESVQTIGTTLQ
jgi:hypothetical protein